MKWHLCTINKKVKPLQTALYQLQVSEAKGLDEIYCVRLFNSFGLCLCLNIIQKATAMTSA